MAEYEYQFDAGLAEQVGVAKGSLTAENQVATSDARGFQMSTVSPLFDSWVHFYDGVHPIADIGAAYGINSLTALHAKNVPHVLAIDMDVKHLHYIEKAHARLVDSNRVSELSTVESKLPELVSVENNSLSSLLVAEVIHFLTGEELPQAFARFFDVLVEGGALNLTCGSVNCHPVGSAPQLRIAENRAKGLKWYGCTRQDESAEWKASTLNFENLFQDKPQLSEEAQRACQATFIHLLSVSQVTQLAENAGFLVVSVKQAKHPGYMSKLLATDFPNIQLIAVKPKSTIVAAAPSA